MLGGLLDIYRGRGYGAFGDWNAGISSHSAHHYYLRITDLPWVK